MKILFPVRTFYPAQTGPANAIYFLAKELVKNEVEVFVITTILGISDLSKIKLNEWIKINGINVYYSDRYFYNLFPKNLLKITIPDIDLIQFVSFFDQINLYFLFLAIKRRIPYLYTPSGELQTSALHIKTLKKKLFMNNFIVKKVIKRAYFHVTSDSEFLEAKKYLKKIKNKNNIFNIPNIIDFDSLNIENYQKIYDFNYILYLGRISRIKNIEILIEVYFNLNLDRNIKLIIAGDINDDIGYYNELKNKVIKKNLEDKIIFTKERVEGKNKDSLYHNAELFILPSKSENFGMVVLESLIKKTPVITTKGTPWKSLNENKCGYWVDMELNSIKNAIENYFSLPINEKNKMKRRGVELAKEFSSEKLIDKYIDMYKKILS